VRLGFIIRIGSGSLAIWALFPKLSDYDVRIKRISKAKVNIDYIYGSAMQGEKEAIFSVYERFFSSRLNESYHRAGSFGKAWIY
jgi:hypothetical protein